MAERVTFPSTTGPLLAGRIDVPVMLRFDNLGLGDSEGDWGDGSFSNKVSDTVQAVRFMNETGREVDLVIAAAHELDTVRAVVSIGAPFEPAHVEHNYDALVDRILTEGEAPFLAGGKALVLRRHFVEDVRAVCAMSILAVRPRRRPRPRRSRGPTR